MTISDRIKQRREELNISQDELAKKLGYKSRSSINKIEKNAHGLPRSKIVAIAKALETTPSYIMGWRDEEGKPIGNYELKPIAVQRLPLLGEVACGKPIFVNEDRESYIESGTAINADFCLKAKGDSMIGARIHDGDIVFIRQQDSVENGDIAIVLINDEATLKRVYYYPENPKLVLQSENPKYEPFVYIGDELQNVTILGKAIAFQSDVK